MWEEKIFSNGDVLSGLFDAYLAEEYLDEDGMIAYDEACQHYQRCIARLEFMVKFIKTNYNEQQKDPIDDGKPFHTRFFP